MKQLCITLTLTLSCILSYAQPAPGIEWQNTIGGSKADYPCFIHQTVDGGFILGGASDSNISSDKAQNSKGERDYWILKINAFGNIQWQKTIGGDEDDVLGGLQQTTDGGYILGGHSESNISGDKTENSWNNSHDYWIVKIDSIGEIEWQNTIGGASLDFLESIHQTADGGYIFGGYSQSSISGDKTEIPYGSQDYWIVKTDAFGNIQWQNTIGGSIWDYLFSLQQTTDGGYILGGYSQSNISGEKTENSMGNSDDYWIIKIDSIGNIQWQNTIGGFGSDRLTSIQQTSDGGYILGGYSSSEISGDKTENCWNHTPDYWIVKTDYLGNIEWQNTIGGPSLDFLESVQQTADGGYILGGHSSSNIGGDKTDARIGFEDYWIVKTDSTGNIEWQNAIGGDNVEYFQLIEQTVDGGFIMSGYSCSDIYGDKAENSKAGSWDYWIVKISTVIGLGDIDLHGAFNLFPNCATDQINIVYSVKQKVTLAITDLWGKEVKRLTLYPYLKSRIVFIDDLPEGMYLVTIKQSEKTIASKKLVIQR